MSIIRNTLTASQIREFFEVQLAEQQALAMAHLADSYWTDSRTGHNIGKDELAATRLLEVKISGLAAEAYHDAELYAQRVLGQLADASHKYRAEYADPDGYGIATIGTVERNLRAFCYG